MPHKDPAVNREYQREWARKNRRWELPEVKERRRGVATRARDTRRRFLDSAKTTVGCEQCGYVDHPDALQLDHPVPVQRKTTGYRDGYIGSWSKTIEVLFECQVLCANCHAIKSAQERRELR